MKEIILIKLGELVLKGLNRNKFEDLLLKNIRNSMRKFGTAKVKAAQSTVYVEFEEDDVDMDAVLESCAKIFGIVTVVKAAKTDTDFENIKEETKSYLRMELMTAKTFKVNAKRADKSYPLNSPQIMALMGEYLLDEFSNLTVDVHEPELTVTVEVREGFAYIHSDPIRGAGGLPCGVSGHALLMLSGGIDSPVAGYSMAKRGLRVSSIHFESPPYTSERARDKVMSLAGVLREYCGHMDVFVVPFTEIQEKIRDCCNEDYFTVIMRRYMLRIACALADKYSAKAIITGESLGQVASQTMGAIACTDAVATMPVFRPLIGTDKQDIINVSRKIGAYDISVLPYEDCCTVFTPKHPKTNPSIAEIEREEAKLPADLIDGIIERIERVSI
ncbi:MAG: tRNA 4-thiouridine(8) synthase ThiI [Ruminococcaceae bacterium]|nr:tRNA 4-thiouridine(8) synthase ThiI [Oscillospiraceae bacterium]